ncbi:MAG: threonine--tRNA ligase [Bacteroidetes bacterium]|nr:threonine--tRNA ligase [Bacteroidota bacterium]
MNIEIKLPDGSKKKYTSSVNGAKIAADIGSSLSKAALSISVNGSIWDLSREIKDNSEIKINTWDSLEGKSTYWHSSAHLMAEAIEKLFPNTKFGIGPAIENGFYYDIDIPNYQLTLEDLQKIENLMLELSKRDVEFIRSEVTWDEAKKYFTSKKDPYKLELLDGLIGKPITMYQQGDFTDLCFGPHIPSSGKIKFVKLLSIAGAYWRGNEKNKMMQRIYGITFPTKKELDDYLFQLEEAKRRDHRKLGVELELFTITPNIGAGLPLWLPKGTIIREELEKFMRREQKKRGYLSVVTPHIANIELFKTSGHYPYYKDSQFPPIHFENGEEFMLKPMNCPHHHQIYMTKPRSYRDLPLRLAEFGTVYRYEQSGELNGLIRVRSFTQDDAHIYCTHEQLKQEIKNTVELTQLVFSTFGMEVQTRLSFRDDNSEKYGGETEYWERAQKEILEVAKEMNLNYFIGIGDASFYGPKIDFMVKDAIGRTWQLGTVQVDYVMPERFKLDYTSTDGLKKRPVIIHRAPFGSMERFVGLLIEHFAGDFPLWIAPVQIIVFPISDLFVNYGTEIEQKLTQLGFRVELDSRNEKIGYKIREAENKKIPYMLVVGEKESSSKTVSVRKHKDGDLGIFKIEDFVKKINQEISIIN